MSSKLRQTHSRRRRVLAAPFVLTAALSGGCYVQPDPQPPAQGHAQRQPQAEPDPSQPTDPSQPPTVVTNPPPPTPTTKPLPPTSGGKVVKNQDGTCWWQPEMPDCPPGVACNPPRPHEVECPQN